MVINVGKKNEIDFLQKEGLFYMNSNSRVLNSLRNIFFGVGNQILILILNFVQR